MSVSSINGETSFQVNSISAVQLFNEYVIKGIENMKLEKFNDSAAKFIVNWLIVLDKFNKFSAAMFVLNGFQPQSL